MKVLFVTHRYPPRTGGVETHVREIATRLADRGHNVTAFSADAGDDLSARTSSKGVRIRRFRSLNPGESFYLAPQMAVAVRRTNADVVHAHNYHAFPLFFAAVGVTDERFVATTHYHGKSANGVRNTLLSGYRPFGRWAVRQADDVIAVSEWERTRVREDFGLEATVIPNGVDVDRFASASREERKRPYLLCVGRLEEYKGVQHVIRTLAELPEYSLLVAGSGPFREELERIAREIGVSDRVEFLGYVDEERLPRLYAGARVFVSMSSFEAYGMTVAEALAAGTPCVVRKAAALEDWTSHDGCVGVEDPDPVAVANCVRTAAERRVVSDDIPTWETVTDEVADRYGVGNTPRERGA
ncbi:glycosyltransferase family 4 protein [Halorubrum rutilum]|uniref:Glycosyltransferase family 4 protein n=1 Tax=Halorubrum rutilum TaxID=1364933 RepID=A0ABD6AJX2_9EURY|nr:glycosyltransferase family 4 protein [Halorubrum rutilum]